MELALSPVTGDAGDLCHGERAGGLRAPGREPDLSASAAEFPGQELGGADIELVAKIVGDDDGILTPGGDHGLGYGEHCSGSGPMAPQRKPGAAFVHLQGGLECPQQAGDGAALGAELHEVLNRRVGGHVEGGANRLDDIGKRLPDAVCAAQPISCRVHGCEQAVEGPAQITVGVGQKRPEAAVWPQRKRPARRYHGKRQQHAVSPASPVKYAVGRHGSLRVVHPVIARALVGVPAQPVAQTQDQLVPLLVYPAGDRLGNQLARLTVP